MTLVLVSPERDHPREHAVLAELFSAGLERLHVRKPHATVPELEGYLRQIAGEFRSRVVLHQHHQLVEKLALGGLHWRDEVGRGSLRVVALREGWVPAEPSPYIASTTRPEASRYLHSRSCHDLTTLQASLGEFDAVFFGPVFSSISKPGYRPTISPEALSELLHARHEGPADHCDPDQGSGGRPDRHAPAWLSGRRPLPTKVIAIGGIDCETAPKALAIGFDGVAVLGAVWQAADPVTAFAEIASSVETRNERSGVCKTDALQKTV